MCTAPSWPLRVRRKIPVDKSHSLTEWSSLPLAKQSPVGAKATHEIRAVCPRNVRRHSPVAASHSRIVWSSDGDASIRPSGDHAICVIRSVCPHSVRTPGGNFFRASLSARCHLSACLFVVMIRRTIRLPPQKVWKAQAFRVFPQAFRPTALRYSSQTFADCHRPPDDSAGRRAEEAGRLC